VELRELCPVFVETDDVSLDTQVPTARPLIKIRFLLRFSTALEIFGLQPPTEQRSSTGTSQDSATMSTSPDYSGPTWLQEMPFTGEPMTYPTLHMTTLTTLLTAASRSTFWNHFALLLILPRVVPRSVTTGVQGVGSRFAGLFATKE
jgi:hypothetical protein